MGPIRALIRSLLSEVKPKAAVADSSTSPDGKAQYGGGERAAGGGAVPVGGGQPQGKRGRFKAAFVMARDANERRSRSLGLTHVLAYTVVIVGAIFLGLTLGGNYPVSKSVLQADGVWAEYVAKYALYLGAGVAGVAAVLLANRSLAAGRGTLLPQALLLAVLLATLASIGLSIYLLTIDVGFDWWHYLLNALMLLQRLLYVAVAAMALVTLWEADRGVAAGPDAGAPPTGAAYSVV